ncbi:MAG TPA: STAS domain-containing protein [Solirubrobacteraceae bacterium]|nr:STAS domain-containing protein [Solirubrobacteraceae bacterium]
MLVDLWDRRRARGVRGYIGRFDPRWRSTDGARSRVVQPAGELAVETEHDDDAVVVALAGELDLPVAPLVQDALERALHEPAERLIIDLSGLTFIDSSGLYTLLQADKRCREAGRELSIRPGPPNVQKVFELTNTVDCLPFARGA